MALDAIQALALGSHKDWPAALVTALRLQQTLVEQYDRKGGPPLRIRKTDGKWVVYTSVGVLP